MGFDIQTKVTSCYDHSNISKPPLIRPAYTSGTIQEAGQMLNPNGTPYQQLQNAYQQPQNIYQQPQNNYQQPQNIYQQPQNIYQQPQNIYQQSQNTYQQPQNTYQQPQNTYQQPQNTYQQPQNTYQQPQNTYQQPQNTYQQPQNNYQQPVSQPTPPPAQFSIPPLPADSTLLKKGQKFTVADKSGNTPFQLKLLLDWDVADSRCDLDASAFLLTERDIVPAEEWFVFYGQPKSPDQSVRYSGNSGKGAQMEIQLSAVSPQIQKIALAVTIYEAMEQNLNFGMVRSISARLVDDRQHELARLDLTELSSAVTALVVGELYRYKGAWKFNAVGSGVKRDLSGFCAMYGIEAG